MISKLKKIGRRAENEESPVPKAGDTIPYAWGVTSKGDNKGTALYNQIRGYGNIRQ